MSNYQFDIPTHHKSIIKVIGIGGGGSNAVTQMFNQGIKDVEFVVANTDAQALKNSQVPTKIQIGTTLTEGLGAGANPEVGKNAALESREDIRELLSHDTKMVFITAGMGGGTGTGAAPVIAGIAKELDVLTVGIVTCPFKFEGPKKLAVAREGIEQLKEYCDTVLVILNDKLRDVYGNLTIRDAFAKADNVLTTAAKSIAEIITVASKVNVDFEDVKTVMKNSGTAVMGSAVAGGENRARKAAEEAIRSPLLDNTEINGAQKLLLSVSYGEDQELTMDEFDEITAFIQEQTGGESDVIFGEGPDLDLGDQIRVTIIATGVDDIEETPVKRTVIDLESNQTVRVDVQAEQPIIQNSGNHFIQKDSKIENQNDKSFDSSPNVEDKKVFRLEDEFKVQEVDYTQNNEESFAEDYRKKMLDQQSKMRRQGMNRLTYNTLNQDEFKEMLEVPAYQRQNIKLQNTPHSSENNISRFNINDDNEILGDNKFLHDNVD